MSLIAIINVLECNGCHTIATFKDGIQHESFQKTWYDGLKYHFCPFCREKPECQAAIAEDEAVKKRIADVIKQQIGSEEKEYVH